MALRRRELLAAAAVLALPRPGAAGPAWLPATVDVPAGPFLRGSSPRERAYAYALDAAAYGSDVTRRQRWYEGELPLRREVLPAFSIMREPVTNALYARFVAETGHRAPGIDPESWRAQRLVHPYGTVLRFLWRDGRPPPGRERHPVVLVSHDDARAFARWLSERSGRTWRLPAEAEWEKAARGTDGRFFPWGDVFDPKRLNSADLGPFDTEPVGSHPSGASPFGMLDAAGQVYEWTATPAGPGRFLVEGGSWDDRGCGVCRPAARHGRPRDLRHVIVGFRLLREAA